MMKRLQATRAGAASGPVRERAEPPSHSPEALGRTRAALQARQLPDGSWGARKGIPGSVEPTALASLALRASPDTSHRRSAHAALAWLRNLQNEDGSWPHSREVPGGSWMTSLAVLALAEDEPWPVSVLTGSEWLLRQEGKALPWHVRLRLWLLGQDPPVALDSTLTGWPWTDGTSSWVEPTAYAILALRWIFPTDAPPEVTGRIREAERMLLNRMCPRGGWNYGNSRVLREELDPYPDTTALVLMALDAGSAEGALSRSLDTLEELLDEHASPLSLSLSCMAFRLHGRPVGHLRARLEERLRGPRLPDTRSLALSAMALDPNASSLSPAPSVARSGSNL